MKDIIEVRWTSRADQAISDIFDFYKKKSLSGAKHVILDILEAPNNIQFSKQY